MIDGQTLRRLLMYDASSGKLQWMPRTRDDCQGERAWKMWNTRSAWREAFTAKHPRGYLIGAVFGKPMIAHRVIWCMVHDRYPIQVDHINGFRADNRLANLREVTNLENHRNVGIQRNNKSGCAGVHWSNKENRWVARITCEGVVKRIGAFVNLPDAVAARKQVERDFNFHPNHGDRVRNG